MIHVSKTGKQAEGFRKARGTWYSGQHRHPQDVLQLGKSLTIKFVDYAVAFDSVSHNYLDDWLVL